MVRDAAQSTGTGVSWEPDDDHRLLRRLLRHSHIFSAAVREVLEEELLRMVSDHPLSLPQFHLLKLIAQQGMHQVGEVAQFLGVSSPAASKNIDKLVRLGLLTRAPDEVDRRVTLLSASRSGQRLVERYEELEVERLGPALEQFRPEEIHGLTRLLDRLSVSLLALDRSQGGFCLKCAAYCEEGCAVAHLQDFCPYEKIRNRCRGVRETGKEVK
ncbi:MAG: hypothetical protein CMJ83_12190 [Planctomycetes bacterium]|jgi:DNA-binding MarR family transcriptional regulator|nr:hypothetical protein [Planctomycetota bacterium]